MTLSRSRVEQASRVTISTSPASILRNNGSILPEPIEAVGAQLGIPHRVHDVAVAEVVLKRAGVDAVIGLLEPAAMAQHVRMNWEGKFGQLPSPADHFEKPGP